MAPLAQPRGPQAPATAKAAQLHLSRLNAAELGKDKIRVNTVNPDAVIAESKIWEGAWAEGLLPRASAEELDRLVGVAMAVIQEEAKGR